VDELRDPVKAGGKTNEAAGTDQPILDRSAVPVPGSVFKTSDGAVAGGH
jgi:hypothetical protein